jgi:hypothetical protein
MEQAGGLLPVVLVTLDEPELLHGAQDRAAGRLVAGLLLPGHLPEGHASPIGPPGLATSGFGSSAWASPRARRLISRRHSAAILL